MFDGLTPEALAARERELTARFETLCRAGLNLDLTRGKPGLDQVALSDPVDAALGGDYRSENGADVRNYGGLTGIPEARRLGAEMLEVDPALVIAGGNASLQLMYQYVLHAWLHGPLGPGTAWRDEPGPLRFLCVVPGYDRHFTITQSLGFELVSVPIREDGPDMDMVEALVTDDPAIKGIWCVPKYSNPTGCVYSDATVDRLAHLARRAGPNFRILWDNAYAVHDLDDHPPVLANLMAHARDAGTQDSVVMFTSTSKITRAGAGISFIAMSPGNLAPFTATLGAQTIGPDKVNQLRHVRYLKNLDGIRALMRRHAAIVRPKFDRVLQHLDDGLEADGVGTWSRPRGGYFLSYDGPPGTAAAAVELARQAGVKLTPAGATFPYGRDPDDTNIRIAPTYPSLDQLDRAMPVFVTAVALAAARQQLRSGVART